MMSAKFMCYDTYRNEALGITVTSSLIRMSSQSLAPLPGIYFTYKMMEVSKYQTSEPPRHSRRYFFYYWPPLAADFFRLQPAAGFLTG